MPTINLWSNVTVNVQSAIGTNLTISGISKTNPGTATSTAHALANGSYVVISAQGMTEVDNRVFRTTGSAANTFILEGEDTSNYGTFTTGSANQITYGNTLSGIFGVNASGGDYDYIDITTIGDKQRLQQPGLANALNYELEVAWDPSDTVQAALKSASLIKAKRAVMIVFSNNFRALFNGYVGAASAPGGTSQEKVTNRVTFTAGPITQYAT